MEEKLEQAEQNLKKEMMKSEALESDIKKINEGMYVNFIGLVRFRFRLFKPFFFGWPTFGSFVIGFCPSVTKPCFLAYRWPRMSLPNGQTPIFERQAELVQVGIS